MLFQRKNYQEHAKTHFKKMENDFADEIKEQIDNTILYSDKKGCTYKEGERTLTYKENYDDTFRGTEIELTSLGTVEAIFSAPKNRRIAALNFADYCVPGGLFFEGATTQEEMLCHASTLYNAIKNNKYLFYAFNNAHRNDGLYLNRALYTPNVIFFNNDNYNDTRLCDIITCAAPNLNEYRYPIIKKAGKKYYDLTAVNDAIDKRARMILSSAAENSAEVVILGAFGCGAFANDPKSVAYAFAKLLATDFAGVFSKVTFAIPNEYSNNYKQFEKMLFEYDLEEDKED